MERVVKLLTEEGIEPESVRSIQTTTKQDTELLQRVKHRAFYILHEMDKVIDSEMDTISGALDPKNDVIGAILEEPQKLTIREVVSRG